jgi:hypothetical protein
VGKHACPAQDIRLKPPIEEKQLVEPTYGKGDNVFLDP